METPEFPQFDENLSDEDIGAISALIASDDRVVHKDILWVSLRRNGDVEARTGKYFGPKAAHGNVIAIERVSGSWQISNVTWFIA